MKKVLITGGTGFIGSNLAGFFLKKGWDVYVVDNLLTSTAENIKLLQSNKLFHFIKKDVISDNFDVFDKEKFNVIYHLASPASPKQYVKFPIKTLLANSVGTLNMLNLAKNIDNCIFIYASTSEVYGDPKVHPQREDYWGNVNPIGIRACYDEGKRFGEALCFAYLRQHNLDIRIARIFNTYGPNMERDDGRVISNFITQALSNQDISVYGNGNQTRSFCYVSDLIEVLYLFSQKSVKGEVINIGNDNEQKIIDIAGLIKKLTDSQSNISFKPLPLDDPKKRKPDLTKARKLLDWKPKMTLEDGLTNTIFYFKNRFDL